MFKKHSIQVQMIKTPNVKPTVEAPTPAASFDPEHISQLISEQVEHTAITVVASFAAIILLKTVSEIAINLSKV